MVKRAIILALVALMAVAGGSAAAGDPIEAVRALVDEQTAPEPGPSGEVGEIGEMLFEQPEQAPPGDGGDDPGLGDRLKDAFAGEMLFASIAGIAATAAGLVGFALVTRYISPKEALKNPQRAMLYGFVKATPGVHLKQLSEEFGMKTSSILWHVRKLESADLVRSERANGYRVFYPVQGGVEVKRLSRAITALHNANARHLYATIDRKPGLSVRDLSERLDIHPGTVRWHVRKLREFGLVDELVREDASLFYGTPTGKKALETLEGTPTTARRAPQGAPVPE